MNVDRDSPIYKYNNFEDNRKKVARRIFLACTTFQADIIHLIKWQYSTIFDSIDTTLLFAIYSQDSFFANFGKPGAGAPQRTNSGNIRTGLRTDAALRWVQRKYNFNFAFVCFLFCVSLSLVIFLSLSYPLCQKRNAVDSFNRNPRY